MYTRVCVLYLRHRTCRGDDILEVFLRHMRAKKKYVKIAVFCVCFFFGTFRIIIKHKKRIFFSPARMILADRRDEPRLEYGIEVTALRYCFWLKTARSTIITVITCICYCQNDLWTSTTQNVPPRFIETHEWFSTRPLFVFIVGTTVLVII